MREFDGPGYKIVQMLTRRRGMAPEQFQRAWLGVDIQAISRLPGLRRYGQNHALVRGYAKGELVFDGFEEFWFETAAAYGQAKCDPAWAALNTWRDAISSPDRALTAAVRVSIQKDGVVPAGAIRSTEFVNRRADLSMPDFRRYWLERHGPLATHIPQIIRYEQNHLDDCDDAAGQPAFDGWAATWFESTGAMRAAAASDAYRDTRADEKNFLAGPLPALFTAERLMFFNV